MTLNFTFSEVNQLLYKNGLKVTLSPNDGYSVNAKYTVNKFLIHRDVYANIRLADYHDDVLEVKYSLSGLVLLENAARNIIRQKLPNFITWVSDDKLRVEINKIPALRKSGYKIRIDDISLSGYVFKVEMKLD